MPINLDLPGTSRANINDIKLQDLLVNDEKHTSLEHERNEISVPKLPTIGSRRDNFDQHLRTSKHVPCVTSVESINVNPVLDNEQSKYLHSTFDNNTSKKQTAGSELNLDSQAVASFKFSIKIPRKQFHKVHTYPEQICCKTTDYPDLSSRRIPVHINSTSTKSTSTLRDKASPKLSKFVKYTFYSSSFDGNILHLKSNVSVKKNHHKPRNEIKNVALQTESLVREDLISDGSRDLPMQIRGGLERSNTHYQRIESNIINTSIQTRTDSQELRHGNKCCCCPVHFESSSSTNMPVTCQPVKDQYHTGYHIFENLTSKCSRNNIITHYISSKFNRKRKRVKKEAKVISDHHETPKTETACCDKAIGIHFIHSANTLMSNDTCDCVLFINNSTWSDSAEHNSTCGFCFNTDCSETNNTEETNQVYNLSRQKSSKCSNPCQLYPECSQDGCKCLVWTGDSTDKCTDNGDAIESSKLSCQTTTNENYLRKTQNYYDTHKENDSMEQKSNKDPLSKSNFVLHQMQKEQTIETDDRAPRKLKEARKNRQKRPSYKLSQDSNFSANCKFAQHTERGEYTSDIHNPSNKLQVSQNLSQTCTSRPTDQASMNCLKCNNVSQTEKLETVRLSDVIDSQIISPFYETTFGQNIKQNFWTSSKKPIDQHTNVLQSKAKNQKLHSKHSSIEQQLKLKLRYGTDLKKCNDRFDLNNIQPTEDDMSSKRSTVGLLSTSLSTEYILTDSSPATSITPTSSKSSVHPYETPSVLNLEQHSETNLHKTKSISINSTFLSTCIGHWKNNSVNSLCNLSALDVSNEMEHDTRQALNNHIFLSEIPINTTKMSSSTVCNAVSKSNRYLRNINSNNESLPYPEISNIDPQKVETHDFLPLANSLVSQGDQNLHRATNICSNNRTPNSKRCNDILCKYASSTATRPQETHSMPMQKVTRKSIAAKNNPGTVTGEITSTPHSSDKVADKCSQWLIENISYDAKSSKEINVIYKKQRTNHTQTTNDRPNVPGNTQYITKKAVKSAQGRKIPSEHISQTQARETPNKSSKRDLKLNQQHPTYKPNWEELATTVNQLQIICNDHTISTEQSGNADRNSSSETRSILAAQACVEILRKQLGVQELRDNEEE